MKNVQLKDINEYKSQSINPSKTPDNVYEVYSVPSHANNKPEYLKGDEIGSNKAVVTEGDVLLCKINPRINRVWVVGKPSEFMSVASSEWIVVRNKAHNPEYLAWYFRSDKFKTLMNSGLTGIGGSLTRAQPKQVATYPVLIRDRKEQDKIVLVLNKVDRIINCRREQIEELDTLIKSRFVEMFGDPYHNPMKWPVRKLEELIVNSNNGMARRGNDRDGNIVLRLVELQDGYIDYSNVNRILLNDKEKAKYLLVDNDFLFARVNGNPDNVGRCAVYKDVGEEVYHNDHIIRVHFDENKLEGVFASSLLNSDYGNRQMKGQIKTSAGQYTISQVGIGAIETVLPPINMQKQFADFVQHVDKLKVEVQKSLDENKILFDSLMQEYFE